MEREGRSDVPSGRGTRRRIIVACIVLNAVFVVVEFAIGHYSNSVGLVSDAGHNVGDIFSMCLALVAVTIGRSERSHAERKALTITMFNAIFLLFIVCWIIGKGIWNLIYPGPVKTEIMMVTAAAGIVVNGISAWMLIKGNDGNLNIKVAFLHAAADALISVGVVISGIIISFTGLYMVDSIYSIIIAVYIAFPAISVLRKTCRKVKKLD